MKICFFGLGSIGRRHLLNIITVLDRRKIQREIHAYRNSAKLLPEDVAKDIDRQIFRRSDLKTYDIVFITNPSALHYETIAATAGITRHMFIEKPVFSSSAADISGLDLKEDSIYYVACPLRYHPVIQYIRKKIDSTKIISARVICSSYLPEWRKSDDYKNYYSAKRSMGGGVSLDLIHEIDYLTYLFGYPEKIINYRRTYSPLSIDSDDLSLYIIQYRKMVAELHLDYFGRVPIRKLELFMENDTIECDLLTSSISFLKKKKAQHCREPKDMYLTEMDYFIDCVIQNKKTHHELPEALRILSYSEGRIP